MAATALFLQRFAPARLVLRESGGALVAASVVLLACYATGCAVLRRTTLLVCTLVGIPAFGTLVAIVSWVSVRPVPWLTYAGALLGVTLMGVALLARARTAPVMPRVPWLLAPPILLALVAALAPVNAPDELIYKLAVPHAYALYGRMLELPLSSNSYLALALQFVDLSALMLSGGIAAKLVHFALYLASLAAVYRLTQRIAPRAAWWPVVMLAWTPALMLIAGWAFSEWGVLGLLALAVERYEDDDHLAAFAAAGGAIAVKYTALPFVAAFALIVLFRHRREPRVLLKAAAITVAFGAFFYLRNAVWTGSPIAPLLLPDAPAVQNYRAGGAALGGWQELFTGADIFDARLVDESLGIAIAVSFLAGLLALGSRNRTARDLAIIGAIQMPILVTIGPGSRNIINGVAALAIAGAAILGEAFRDLRPSLRTIGGFAIGVALAAQGVLVLFSFSDYDVLPYLGGQESAEQYIARQRAFAKPYAWLERETPRDARVLLFGEHETFELDRPFLAATNLDGPRVAHWLARFPTPEALHAELRAQHVSYVLLRPRWYRVAQPGQRPLTPIESELALEVPPQIDRVLKTMLQTHATLRYRDDEFLIFELSS